MKNVSPHCAGCGKNPAAISEYVIAAKRENMFPDDYVRLEEGTYNSRANTFYCTDCYVKAGCPSGVAPFIPKSMGGK